MKASVTMGLVNAAEVLYKPRRQLAKQCVLYKAFSTSLLQHGGSHHRSVLAIAGQMPYAMTSNGKYIAEETACMLQNGGGERCEECAAAWPLQPPYSCKALTHT